LRPAPKVESGVMSESIELQPPGPGTAVFTAKTDVVVTFNRDDFLKAARCMKLEKAVRYVEEETGRAPESPLMDAFQLSFVVAAMLDAGRASVRLEDERESRKSIVRDGFSETGCAGRCRSFGRRYRLSVDDRFSFFQVTDKNQNDGE
jgi:hypothetical protein